MKQRMRSFFENEKLMSPLASLVAIIIGLAFGFIILIITSGANSLPALRLILMGGFHHGLRGFGNVLFRATPIIMTGLSVGFAFKTGLFNIGVTGQFTVGAFAAVFVGVNFSFLPSGWGWIVGVLAGMIAGALWAGVVGLLKAYRNVNEVIASIMMNYIGMYTVNYLIRNTAYDQVHSRTLPTVNAFLPRMGLDTIFVRSSLNIGIILAIIMAVIVYVILEKTTFGYELKAVGLNRRASRYAGINEKKSIILSMVIAGGLAGIGGSLVYLSDVGRYMTTVNALLAEGFDGIAVALLAQSNPLAIIFSGFLISHITYGGNNLQLYGLEPEIIQVISATIIYMSALSLLLRQLIHRVLKGRKEKKS